MSEHPTAGPAVLIVDDEPAWLRNFGLLLRTAGVPEVVPCQGGEAALVALREREVAVACIDLHMPGLAGRELLARIQADHPEVRVIVITGVNEVETAVECMKLGAFDYFVKSTETSRLVAAVKRALELRELSRENRLLTERLVAGGLARPELFVDIVTRDPALLALFRYAEAIAVTRQPVLITGESGTGKELMARAVHAASGRRGEFVPVNVAGLDDNVFSDTLFGHRKGAFTGADENRPGLVERAAGGTLFLDEIGDVSPAGQVKLLRLIQEREYSTLGSDAARKSDARVVVATNQDLRRLREAGRFRADLFYRLHTHALHLPPLRQRPGDVPLLLDHFLDKAARELGKRRPTPPRELPLLLQTYTFPGNVRELEGMVFDAVSRHTARMLGMETFRAHIEGADGGEERAGAQSPAGSAPGTAADAAAEAAAPPALVFPARLPTLAEVADQLVAEALARASGNQAIAARLIGVSRQALNRRLNRRRG